MKKLKEVQACITKLYVLAKDVGKKLRVDLPKPKDIVSEPDLLDEPIHSIMFRFGQLEGELQHYKDREKSLEISLKVHKDEIFQKEKEVKHWKHLAKGGHE